MGPRRSRPGLISFSGRSVSTIVLTMATYIPFAQTLWVEETMAMYMSTRIAKLEHIFVNLSRLTVSSVHLVLRDDDLNTIAIVCAWDRVFQETDHTYKLASFDGSDLCCFRIWASDEVTGISDDLLSFDRLITASNANKLPIGIGDNFVDLLIEHVSSAIDGTETSEGLWEFAKTI